MGILGYLENSWDSEILAQIAAAEICSDVELFAMYCRRRSPVDNMVRDNLDCGGGKVDTDSIPCFSGDQKCGSKRLVMRLCA